MYHFAIDCSCFTLVFFFHSEPRDFSCKHQIFSVVSPVVLPALDSWVGDGDQGAARARGRGEGEAAGWSMIPGSDCPGGL